jgi:hypothetical protein
VDIDLVQQRPGYLGAITLNLKRRAGAFSFDIAQESARARIHGGHQHEIRRVAHRGRGSGNNHLSLFHGLTQNLQDIPSELRQFVQEKHAVMRQTDLSRFGVLTATDEPGIADGMVGRLKGPDGVQPAPLGIRPITL